MNKKIKYLIIDVDGTLTDGKIYIGDAGEAVKAFQVKDGYAIKNILSQYNIKPIILTARTSNIVANRCRELGITECYQGVGEKAEYLKQIFMNMGDYNSSLGNCAYIGDDIPDLQCMLDIKAAGGIVACPFDAAREIRNISNYVCKCKAGDGAVREFIELLTTMQIDEKNDILEERINYALEYLKTIDFSNIDFGKHVVNDFFSFNLDRYTSKVEAQCKLESHRKYVDIHMVLSGCERIKLVDTVRLQIQEEYNQEVDVEFWQKPTRMLEITLKPDNYAIFYPENAHSVGIECDNPQEVIKVVGKVRI